MIIKTNYDGCPYITAGKEYRVSGAVIFADDGQVIDLDDVIELDWQVVEEGRFSQEVAQEMYDLLEEMCETYDDNVYLYIDDIRELLAKARGEL